MSKRFQRWATTAIFAWVMTGLSGISYAAGDAEAGAALWRKNNCASCHGADARSPTNPTYPKLAGQHADYLVFALKQYQRGQAVGAQAVVGSAALRTNAIMGAFAKPLSETDIKNLAAYLASLPSDLYIRR